MATAGLQGTFDDLGTSLADVTFVVVDVETTGGAPIGGGLTEIGAVKVRGGEVLGEFSTLVDPGEPVPPFIALLTGISDRTLLGAPTRSAALGAFLDFAAGAVLVAHNASYDTGFLAGGCALTGHRWPKFHTVDTVRLARCVLGRGEVPNVKLATLAQYFGARTRPVHRALADARATVDVFHGLLERAAGLGVVTLEDLSTMSSRVDPLVRRKRHLADGLPDTPGVYVFRDDAGTALYVGKSRHIRTRVRTYFTASEKRSRMALLVRAAVQVTPIPCSTELEAEVRELRLIAEHRPRFNRRSVRPDRAVWVKMTVEAYPRLSIVRTVRADVEAGAAYLGPFSSRADADAVCEVVRLAVPLRACTTALRPGRATSSCVLADLERCIAPCRGDVDVATYDALTRAARAAFTVDSAVVEHPVRERLMLLGDSQRFEQAAVWRDRLEQFARAATRTQALGGIAAVEQLVAARARADGGWDVHVVRYGRLSAAGAVPGGVDPLPHVDALVATAADVRRAPTPMPAALPAETDRILHWLETGGTRLVSIAGPPWTTPVGGGGRLLAEMATLRG